MLGQIHVLCSLAVSFTGNNTTIGSGILYGIDGAHALVNEQDYRIFSHEEVYDFYTSLDS